MRVALGSEARDRISGYKGIVIARYEYINGCVRYEVAAADKDGKPESFVFDVEQLEVLKEPKERAKSSPTGGPRDNRPVPR